MLRFLAAVTVVTTVTTVTATTVTAAPTVVVSVPPVHSLVAAVMHGVGAPALLLPAGGSPHGGALRPSQARALAAADLVVWVGPALERQLAKPVAAAGARVVTLTDAAAVSVLPSRGHDDGHGHGGHDDGDGHGHDGHDDDDGHGHDGHDDDGHAADTDDGHADWQLDPHLWLSFANAAAIVRIAADELSRIDAANRDRYHANADATLSRIVTLRARLQKKLRAVDANYIVFHDAYQYFETEFDLQPAAVVTLGADRSPGAKHVRQIKRLIREQNIRCVFSEPQFRSRLVRTLVAGTDAAAGVLDPLGATLTPGPSAWFALMENLADALLDCLR